MARKFLYIIAILIVVAIAAGFAMRLFPGALSRAALVPTAAFEDQPTLAENAYDDPAMWFSMPGKSANDPSRWVPPGVEQAEEGTLPAAVFFVHPTSYLDRARWNAPLKDEQSQLRAQLFLRGIASPFGMAKEIWAPRYRQATFGAFLTDKPEGQQALDAAYADVEMAFDRFVASIGPDVPIVLAGHSQGALHILRLLKEKIAGTPLQARIAMAYPIGWPISREHDLPALALPACESPEQTGCIVAWASYTDEADANDWLETYRSSAGFDGQVRGDSAIVCVNPLTGTAGGEAPAEANLGTLRPSSDLTTGEIIPAAVPARCDDRGLLRIGDGPDLGPYVLPGGNYHVYDVPLFWANLRQDFARRIGAWATAH